MATTTYVKDDVVHDKSGAAPWIGVLIGAMALAALALTVAAFLFSARIVDDRLNVRVEPPAMPQAPRLPDAPLMPKGAE